MIYLQIISHPQGAINRNHIDRLKDHNLIPLPFGVDNFNHIRVSLLACGVVPGHSFPVINYDIPVRK